MAMLTTLPAKRPAGDSALAAARRMCSRASASSATTRSFSPRSRSTFSRVLFGGAVALLPIFAKDILAVGPAGLGWLRAAPGIGALMMALITTRLPPWQHPGRVLLLVVAGFGLATIGFGLSRSFTLSLACLFLTGVFDNVSVVIRLTLEQIITPDHLRGRVSRRSTTCSSASPTNSAPSRAERRRRCSVRRSRWSAEASRRWPSWRSSEQCGRNWRVWARCTRSRRRKRPLVHQHSRLSAANDISGVVAVSVE